MLNLLKADFYKLKKSRTFLICTVISILLAVFLIVAIHQWLNHDPDENDRYSQEIAEMKEEASGIWALEYFLTAEFHLIIIGVFVAIFISSEFGNGTIKNTLSRGAGRVNIFISKFAISSCASLTILFTFMLVILVAGTIAWGFGTASASELIRMMALQALIIITYTAMFSCISISLRGIGGAIATNIICVTMVSMLLGAIGMLFDSTINIGDYWIGEAASMLATTTPANTDVIKGIFIAFGWGIVSMLVGSMLFKKIDVK
jgi:ABC-type transport system involved in multi-copper enzyme maturation permease subunit